MPQGTRDCTEKSIMSDAFENLCSNEGGHVPSCFGWRHGLLLSLVMTSILFEVGCQTVTGVPVSRVPRQILQTDLKSRYEDVALQRLRQDVPEVYLLGAGDVIGVYIKGVLGTAEELPPIHYPEDSNRPPAIGYPVPVREDGSLALPFVAPIRVQGLSIVAATEKIRQAYTTPRAIIKPDSDQVIITLIRKRTTRVMVIREEAGGKEGVSKRGTGHVVDLPAYENDVLRALTETGGMPGTDAKNEVMIYRGMFNEAVSYDQIMSQLNCNSCQDPCVCNEAPVPDPPNVTRIPLRYNPSNPPVFTQRDVILNDGDIVVIRSRDEETFVTAGVLGGGEFPLPRDKDLDILGAIAIAGGPLGNAGTGVGGVGAPNGGGAANGGRSNCQPSEAIIVRELPCGNSISIKVDLNRALQDRSERILIQPNDVIILRYTLAEEFGNALLNMLQINFLLGSGINR
jgi:protein involved in polysaccharide export with SLBB domain